MTADAIDLDMLDKLFDNQKNLDNIFSSIFDDEPVSASSQPSDEPIFDGGSWENDQGFHFDENASFDTDETYVREKRNIAYSIVPVVLEIVAIYYGISYFL